MLNLATGYVTPEDYLAVENISEAKHEYFSGKVLAMAGASDNHNRIVRNLIGEIYNTLKGKDCEVYPSDLRVTTPFSDSFMYPDVSIICGDIQKKDVLSNAAINPGVIIEVMSPSTMKTDKELKSLYYRQIPSLKEYILVDSVTDKVQATRKQKDGTWKIEDVENVLAIETINTHLSLTVIYDKVVFNQ